MPTFFSQLRTTVAVYSGPLFDRMCSGIPRDEEPAQKLEHIVALQIPCQIDCQ